MSVTLLVAFHGPRPETLWLLAQWELGANHQPLSDLLQPLKIPKHYRSFFKGCTVRPFWSCTLSACTAFPKMSWPTGVRSSPSRFGNIVPSLGSFSQAILRVSPSKQWTSWEGHSGPEGSAPLCHPFIWKTFLPWAEYAHNSLTSSATGMSPFHVVLGYQPPLFPEQEMGVAVPSPQVNMHRIRRVGD